MEDPPLRRASSQPFRAIHAIGLCSTINLSSVALHAERELQYSRAHLCGRVGGRGSAWQQAYKARAAWPAAQAASHSGGAPWRRRHHHAASWTVLCLFCHLAAAIIDTLALGPSARAGAAVPQWQLHSTRRGALVLCGLQRERRGIPAWATVAHGRRQARRHLPSAAGWAQGVGAAADRRAPEQPGPRSRGRGGHVPYRV